MNSDIVQGSMKELKGKIKHTWGKLTDDDINSLDGGVDQFIGKVQKTYGYTKERAIEEFDKFRNQNSNYFDNAYDSSRRSFDSALDRTSDRFKRDAGHLMDEGAHYAEKAREFGHNIAHRGRVIVRDNPGYTLLGAVAVGFLCGALICSRRSMR